MRGRKLENNEQQPISILRRSPRFLHRAGIEYPETPNPAERKFRTHDSFSAPLGSSIARAPKNGGGVSRSLTKSSQGSRRRSSGLGSIANLADKRVTRSSVRCSRFVNNQVNKCEQISRKGDRKVTALKCSDKSRKESDRSTRLRDGASVSNSEEVLDSQMERRVTKRSVCGNKFVNNDINSEKNSGERVSVFSKEVKAKVVCFNYCKQSIGNVEKRVTRGTTRMKTMQSIEKADIKNNNVSTDGMRKVIILDERKPKGAGELYTSKRDVKKLQVGGKRKRGQVEEDHETIHGWTEEQELALRRAYFAAKPTPHFWKKVARMVSTGEQLNFGDVNQHPRFLDMIMFVLLTQTTTPQGRSKVPGKSAGECFNRIHYDHLTPPQPRTRSRANRKQPSPVSYSNSKWLSPAETKTKRLQNRRKTLLAQKTVRQLLEKQRNEDQDYKADLFSVLEPNIELSSLNFQGSTTPFASPVGNRGSSSILTRCLEMSSSAHKKQLSRSSCLGKATFVSPPVLKQIKNKALHEKYIDQLHCRDAKRKAQSLRNAKSIRESEDKMTGHLEVNLVKVAKDALVIDARDAINKFRNLQSSTSCSTDDDDDVRSCNDEDEDDDILCL
ncbi:hypothetical protein OROGR_015917 [Orobanche gracilis]